MKTDFSPCPFCGPQQVQPQAFDTKEGSFIRCMSCGGSTDHYIDTESAAEAWNTRSTLTPPEDPAAEVAKRLLGRFMIECNAVGSYEAGYGLARSLRREMPELLAARPEAGQ